MKKNILVFPAGSEIALEIHRSMKYSTHFNLIGASSVDDHGQFIFENYIGGLPFYTEESFLDQLLEVIKKYEIDAIYPAMDAVAKYIKKNESYLNCIVIGSSLEASTIAASKSQTYKLLSTESFCPQWYASIDSIPSYPVFMKPDEGYGSRNVKLVESRKAALAHIEEYDQKYVYCEYLPGKEFTIDCFTNKEGKLLFAAARERSRISGGISVSTTAAVDNLDFFLETAEKINSQLCPRGAWFFQMKENTYGEPILLEVATRLGGSSSYFRAKGVNFALLSAFDAFDAPVDIITNDYFVELDRALSNKYKLSINYSSVYVDFDDCIIVNNSVNINLINFLFQCLNEGIRIILITRHSGHLNKALEKFRLSNIFDEIIHIVNNDLKSDYIDKSLNPIFIDDSYAERKDVKSNLGIYVFSPDMVEALLK